MSACFGSGLFGALPYIPLLVTSYLQLVVTMYALIDYFSSYSPSSYSSPHSKEKEDSSLRRLDLLGAVLLDCNNIVVLNNMNISYSFLAIAKQLEESQLRVDMIE